jgi:hypothetical protein
MFNRNLNKNIVVSLNNLFDNYEELRRLCNALDNDLDTVIKYISKIIKFAFCDERFVYSDMGLGTIISELGDVEEKYSKYLSNYKNSFIKLSRKLEYPIDEDIRLNDILLLKLPDFSLLKEICNSNKREKEELAKENEIKEKYYKVARGFDEVELSYERFENVYIDRNFIYSNYNLSGNLYRDFCKMYNDDRYSDKTKDNNPLKESFQKNYEKIKKFSDISLIKKGNVYEIVNGRHRILYLLVYGGEVEIPATVSHRIESKRVNITLGKLKREYGIRPLKDNIMNDDCQLLLIYNEKAFLVKSEEELLTFYEAVSNNYQLDEFYFDTFKNINGTNKEKDRLRIIYDRFILSKYEELGDDIITSNFTDFCSKCSVSGNYLLYHAFSNFKFDYTKAHVLGYDFYEFMKKYSESYDKIIGNDDDDNKILIYK